MWPKQQVEVEPQHNKGNRNRDGKWQMPNGKTKYCRLFKKFMSGCFAVGIFPVYDDYVLCALPLLPHSTFRLFLTSGLLGATSMLLLLFFFSFLNTTYFCWGSLFASTSIPFIVHNNKHILVYSLFFIHFFMYTFA